jgi:acyl-CoA dehydrogenase
MSRSRCPVPDKAYGTAEWYRQLGRASRNFALVADVTVAVLGGGLKTRQKLTGRLADALSELYLLACVLKRYEDDGKPAGDRLIVELCARNGLYRFQQALDGTIDNFPNWFVRLKLRGLVFPFGRPYRPASDRLGHQVVALALEPGEVRDRLTREIYVSRDVNDPTGLLEVTLEKVVAAEEAERKLERAIRAGTVRRYHGIDWLGDAERQGVLTTAEAKLLREVETLTARVIAVDHFDPAEIKPHYMKPGHNAQSVQKTDQRSAAAE